jgi:hypothetical protein
VPNTCPALPWERTGLVARTVFKTVEAFARGLVGSIPTRSRQNVPILRGFCGLSIAAVAKRLQYYKRNAAVSAVLPIRPASAMN